MSRPTHVQRWHQSDQVRTETHAVHVDALSIALPAGLAPARVREALRAALSKALLDQPAAAALSPAMRRLVVDRAAATLHGAIEGAIVGSARGLAPILPSLPDQRTDQGSPWQHAAAPASATPPAAGALGARP